MNTEDPDRELDEAYRRASAEDAGRPAAATRQAILAQAAEAARRNTPAANQPRYWMRAVAGVAVLGVGIMMWRQMDHRMPGAPAGVTVPVTAEAAPQQAASAQAEAKADRANQQIIAESPAITEPPPPPAPPAFADQPVEQELGESRRETAAVQRNAAPALTNAAAQPQLAPPELASLFRVHFPQLDQSGARHIVWLVRAPDGAVLLSGEFTHSASVLAVPQHVTAPAGQVIVGWRFYQLRSTAGGVIQLAVAEAR